MSVVQRLSLADQPPARITPTPSPPSTSNACLFLISNESSYVNAHALLVDGGLGVGVMRAG